MGLFNRKPNENKLSFKRKMAEKIVQHDLRYVSERIEDTDIIITKGGDMHLIDDIITIRSSYETGSKIVFRCSVENLVASELMSLDGAILEGPDLNQDGKIRRIIVYYVYYR